EAGNGPVNIVLNKVNNIKSKNLPLSITGEDETAVKENTHRIISFGETSGADLTTGIICALTRIPEI
ncbi:hypothetical protein LCGC14_3152090, partial [marine sediment metagenome]